MKNILIAAVLMGIILFSNCKKTPIAHTPIDSFLLQNFNYKPGTYWIYRDSLSGTEDSFYVRSQSYYSETDGSTSSSVIDHSKIIIDQNDYSKSKIAEWTMDISFHEIDVHYIGNIEIIYDEFIIIPYTIGLIGHNSNDSGYVISINYNYSIYKNTYENVVEMRHLDDVDLYNPHFDNLFFFNSDVGIIKMVLHQDTLNSILELSRWNIIK